MIIIGFLILVFGIGVLLTIELGFLKNQFLAGLLMSIVGFGMMIYDGTSPIERVSQHTVYTDKIPEKNIEFIQDCKITTTKYESSRRGAITGEKTKYTVDCGYSIMENRAEPGIYKIIREILKDIESEKK